MVEIFLIYMHTTSPSKDDPSKVYSKEGHLGNKTKITPELKITVITSNISQQLSEVVFFLSRNYASFIRDKLRIKIDEKYPNATTTNIIETMDVSSKQLSNMLETQWKYEEN